MSQRKGRSSLILHDFKSLSLPFNLNPSRFLLDLEFLSLFEEVDGEVVQEKKGR